MSVEIGYEEIASPIRERRSYSAEALGVKHNEMPMDFSALVIFKNVGLKILSI